MTDLRERVAEPVVTVSQLSRVERRRREREQERRRRWQTLRPGRVPFWIEFPVLVVGALLVAFTLKSVVVEPFFIPSGSMETTLHGCPGCQGDRVLVNKFVYTMRDPYRGEIVVFHGQYSWRPETTVAPAATGNAATRAVRSLTSAAGLGQPDDDIFIKRVIGLPGDVVTCCDVQGRVIVNGTPLNEPYIYQNTPPAERAFPAIRVPPGRLWVMGDHRSESADSRFHMQDPGGGTIAIDHVLGRAVAIAWPAKRSGTLPRPFYGPIAPPPPAIKP